MKVSVALANRILLSPLRRLRLALARSAARSANWREAERRYQLYLGRYRDDIAAWVQLGHAFKEQGKLAPALSAYGHAVDADPDREEGWLHLAHCQLRMRRPGEALATLLAALQINPTFPRIAAMVLDLGQRDKLPLATLEQIEAVEGIYSLSRYATWREVSSREKTAPAIDRSDDSAAVIYGDGIAGDLLDVTLATLGGMTCLGVVDDASGPGDRPAMRELNLGNLEPRISYLLFLEAGTRLEAGAIEHLRTALDQTGAAAAYADHDHWWTRTDDGEQQPFFGAPCFQPMHDRVWLEACSVRPPAMLLARGALPASVRSSFVAEFLTSTPARCVHVPRLLASRSAEAANAGEVTASSIHARPVEPDPIQIVIQTRDAPALLDRCLTGLFRTADDPSGLDVVVVDNRSILPETQELLRQWSEKASVRTIRHDEDFNWSRANNLAVREGTAPCLLFLNNDVEIETRGWDNAMRGRLARPENGIVGTLLLYPDRTIQHAGIVFGTEAGGPVHAGVNQSIEAGWPAMHWTLPRLVSAVTGAFMATTRALFLDMGGFDEALPVSFNDVDLCLRCRALGRQVLLACEIVAIHLESASRGIVQDDFEQARDRSDWQRLRQRWGASLDLDPAFNPHWTRRDRPFDGIISPTDREVDRWIMASAEAEPWRIAPPAQV